MLSNRCPQPWLGAIAGAEAFGSCCTLDEASPWAQGCLQHSPNWGYLTPDLAVWNSAPLQEFRRAMVRQGQSICGDRPRCYWPHPPSAEVFEAQYYRKEATPEYMGNVALVAQDWAQGRPISEGLPLAWAVAGGFRCRLNCLFCHSIAMADQYPAMSLDQARIVRRLIRSSVRYTLTGGEPFDFEPSLLDLLLPEPGEIPQLQVEVYTAFGQISSAEFQRWAGRIHELHISIDTPDPAVYASLRRGSTLQHWMELAHIARAAGAQLYGVAVVCGRTLESLPALPYFLKAHGFSHLQCLRLINVWGEGGRLQEEDVFGTAQSPANDERIAESWRRTLQSGQSCGLDIQDAGIGSYLASRGIEVTTS